MSETERKPWFPTFAKVVRWRIWRVAACVILLVLLLGGLLHVASTAYFGSRVKAELRALKAAGKPVTFADLAPPPVRDDQNAAPLYAEAGRILVRHVYGTRTPGRPTRDDAVPLSAYPYGYVDDDWNDPAVRACWTELVREDRAALDLIRRASGRPRYDLRIDYPRFLYGSSASIPWRELLALEAFSSAAAIVSSHEAQPQEALERLRMGCVLHRQLFTEPAFLLLCWGVLHQDARLMRAVNHVTARGPIPKREARRLDDELGRLDFTALSTPVWDASRAGVIENCADTQRERRLVLYDQPNVWYDRPIPLGRWVVWWLVTGPYRRPALLADELRVLRVMEQEERLIHMPAPQRYRLPEARGASRRTPYPWLPDLNRMLGISAMWDLRRHDAAQTSRNLARTGLGLQLYRQTHGGYPPTLDDLRRDRWKVPKDLFTDRDFVYQPRGERFVLYSLGFDQDDDGGRQVNWLRRTYRDKPKDPRSDEGDIAWEK